jgi:hypothetical protein
MSVEGEWMLARMESWAAFLWNKVFYSTKCSLCEGVAFSNRAG